jgi:hypothetical protein
MIINVNSWTAILGVEAVPVALWPFPFIFFKQQKKTAALLIHASVLVSIILLHSAFNVPCMPSSKLLLKTHSLSHQSLTGQAASLPWAARDGQASWGFAMHEKWWVPAARHDFSPWTKYLHTPKTVFLSRRIAAQRWLCRFSYVSSFTPLIMKPVYCPGQHSLLQLAVLRGQFTCRLIACSRRQVGSFWAACHF